MLQHVFFEAAISFMVRTSCVTNFLLHIQYWTMHMQLFRFSLLNDFNICFSVTSPITNSQAQATRMYVLRNTFLRYTKFYPTLYIGFCVDFHYFGATSLFNTSSMSSVIREMKVSFFPIRVESCRFWFQFKWRWSKSIVLWRRAWWLWCCWGVERKPDAGVISPLRQKLREVLLLLASQYQHVRLRGGAFGSGVAKCHKWNTHFYNMCVEFD